MEWLRLHRHWWAWGVAPLTTVAAWAGSGAGASRAWDSEWRDSAIRTTMRATAVGVVAGPNVGQHSLGESAESSCPRSGRPWEEAEGALLLSTGVTQFGRPSIGSWVAYGLGSESSDLPGFVVLGSGSGPNAGANIWSNGFLPSAYQGTRFRSVGEPILYVSSPDGITDELQRARLDTIRHLNAHRLRRTGDPEISARTASYELAFRMQIAVPGLLDFGSEPKHVHELYGIGAEPEHGYATNCLLARRMVERGVRFAMLTHGDWDNDKELDKGHANNSRIVDRPTAALIRDLEQRGLLESTLVIWASEFGRTPMAQLDRQDEEPGRDHHPDCFSMWLAGGGTTGGRVVGKTDDIGLKPVEGRVQIHDLQATVLHCLGFDHENLTYRHQGRNFRLTDVSGRVVEEILA